MEEGVVVVVVEKKDLSVCKEGGSRLRRRYSQR